MHQRRRDGNGIQDVISVWSFIVEFLWNDGIGFVFDWESRFREINRTKNCIWEGKGIVAPLLQSTAAKFLDRNISVSRQLASSE
mmetsp:Transcript_20637/g.35175  ORF Transcript_20637/g.35175 Transcript_20637/m.35175 type:complete len:84 (-) Transcript_20637:2566-2817(-)